MFKACSLSMGTVESGLLAGLGVLARDAPRQGRGAASGSALAAVELRLDPDRTVDPLSEAFRGVRLRGPGAARCDELGPGERPPDLGGGGGGMPRVDPVLVPLAAAEAEGSLGGGSGMGPGASRMSSSLATPGIAAGSCPPALP